MKQDLYQAFGLLSNIGDRTCVVLGRLGIRTLLHMSAGLPAVITITQCPQGAMRAFVGFYIKRGPSKTHPRNQGLLRALKDIKSYSEPLRAIKSC